MTCSFFWLHNRRTTMMPSKSMQILKWLRAPSLAVMLLDQLNQPAEGTTPICTVIMPNGALPWAIPNENSNSFSSPPSSMSGTSLRGTKASPSSTSGPKPVSLTRKRKLQSSKCGPFRRETESLVIPGRIQIVGFGGSFHVTVNLSFCIFECEFDVRITLPPQVHILQTRALEDLAADSRHRTNATPSLPCKSTST